MVFMLFTLSMACTMAYCPTMTNSAEAASSVDDMSSMPCHEKDDNSDQEQAQSPMLSADCVGVDLLSVNDTFDFSPILTFDHIDYAWADINIDYTLYLASATPIRAPPLYEDTRLHDALPVYMTTQRLRL